MPMLRRAPDNTLAETLGKFANSFGNPQSWAEAQLLQRRILMQDLEYQQKQRAIAAEQAAEFAMQKVPGMTPEVGAEVLTMLRNNPGDAEKAFKWALIRTHHWDTSGTPEGDRKNVEMYTTIYGTHPTGTVFTGSNQEQIAREAARTKGLESYETARGTALGTQEARKGLPQFEDNPNDPDSYKRDVQTYIRLKGEPPPADWVPGNNWKQVMDRYQGDLAAKKAADVERAKQGVTGIPPTGNVFPDNPPFPNYPTIGGASPQPGQPASPAAASGSPGAGAAASGSPGAGGNVTQPSPLPGTYTQPTPVITNLGGGYHQIGQTQAQAEAAKGRSALDEGVMTKAYSGLSTAVQLQDKLQQMAALTQIINSGSVTGQAATGILRFIQEHTGLTIGSVAEARGRLNQILQSEIPDLVKEMNSRFAGPEIKSYSSIVGSPDAPPNVSLSNIARLQALTEAHIKQAHDAGQVLYTKNMTPEQYQAADEARWMNFPVTVRKLQGDYGIHDEAPGAFGAPIRVGPATVSPPPPSPAQAAPPPVQAAPPPVQAAPPPAQAAPTQGGPRIFQMNPNGTLVMPQQPGQQ